MSTKTEKLIVQIFDNFLKWEAELESASICDKEKQMEAYRMWQHCEKILRNNTVSQYQLIDCITTLRRIINHRYKLMNEIYNFQMIPIEHKSKSLHEQLENFGLIRPFMLKQLIDIRGLIEHQFKKPPSKRRCLEFLDIVWYFLKGTDGHVNQCLSGMILYCREKKFLKNEYWVSFDFDMDKKWLINISGWFPERFLIKDSGIKVEVENIENKGKAIKRLGVRKDISRKNANDFWLHGKVLSCSPSTYEELFKVYFSL